MIVVGCPPQNARSKIQLRKISPGRMIDRILTVGGITLLSRVTGFLRDIMLAAVLGAGPVADAFFVALRLPNHFRAIFAEGAFNAAFIPAYARVRVASGERRGAGVRRPHFHAAAASQVVLLGVALVVHAVGDRPAGAGILQGAGQVRAGGRSDADHVSLSAAGQPRHAVRRHPQRAGPFRRRRRGAHPAQSVDDDDARAGGVFPDRRTRRGLGRAARRLSGILAGRRRRRAQWACCRGSPGRGSTQRCCCSSNGSARRPSARPAPRSRCSPTPSSQASSPPARCRRSIMPIG